MHVETLTACTQHSMCSGNIAGITAISFGLEDTVVLDIAGSARDLT